MLDEEGKKSYNNLMKNLNENTAPLRWRSHPQMILPLE
jgi:hypothetical protein